MGNERLEKLSLQIILILNGCRLSLNRQGVKMIYKKDLKDYEFKTIEEYFDYILESKINGQPTQVKRLIADLSPDQKKQFINYLFGVIDTKSINYWFNLIYLGA